MIWLNKNNLFSRYLPLALSIILVATAGLFWYVHPARAGYTYSRTITIAHGQVGNGTEDEPSFTVLVCANGSAPCNTSVPGLNQSGGGAHVQNASGYDIIFSSTSNCTTLMNWEVEKYVPSTGELEAWVLITSLSHTSDTTFYMCYGNGAIPTFQGGSTGSAWDSNYKGVWHLPNGTSLTANDSTSNGNNGTLSATPPTATTGQIDGAASFNGSSNYITTPSITLNTTYTYSAWVHSAVPTQSAWNRIMESSYEGNGYLGTNSAGSAYCFIVNSDLTNVCGGTITTSGFHYVNGTYDGTTATLYVDGNQVASHAESNPGSSNLVLYISTYFAGLGTYGWNGVIDEVRVSNLARSPGWLKTEYNNEFSSSSFEIFGSETSTGGTGPASRGLTIKNVKVVIKNAKVRIQPR